LRWLNTQALFAAADIAVAALIWRLGQLQGASEGRCRWGALLWLYNPFTVTISTRGSCDSLVTVLLLAALLLLLRGRRLAPALLYGLAVHARIYPIVYAPAIVLFLARQRLQQQQQQQGVGSSSSSRAVGRWVAAVLREGLAFGCASGGTFLALGAAFYRLYGHTFLQEAFLHHLTRRDPRHNFSPHFYPTYLTFMRWPEAGSSGSSSCAAAAGAGGGGWQQEQPVQLLGCWLPQQTPDVGGPLAALPQAGLLLVLAATLHARLPLCWLLTTWAFVALNRVSTAQYFVWFFGLLPAVLQHVAWPLPRKLVVAGAVWAAAQLHWLAWAYLLEFQGQGVHLMLWGASTAFLAANALCMCALIECCSGSSGSAGTPGASRQRSRSRLKRATPAPTRRSSRLQQAAADRQQVD
jgi:phosphatidylinositol glycan class M